MWGGVKYVWQRKLFTLCTQRRHTFRDRRPCTTVQTRLHINWNSVWLGKNILYWIDQSCKGEIKISYTAARRAQPGNQGRTPSICTLWVPIHLSFNSQKEPPLSGLSGTRWLSKTTVEILQFTKQPVQVCPVRLKASKRAEIKEKTNSSECM